jgi:hypothetical protein
MLIPLSLCIVSHLKSSGCPLRLLKSLIVGAPTRLYAGNACNTVKPLPFSLFSTHPLLCHPKYNPRLSPIYLSLTISLYTQPPSHPRRFCTTPCASLHYSPLCNVCATLHSRTSSLRTYFNCICNSLILLALGDPWQRPDFTYQGKPVRLLRT